MKPLERQIMNQKKDDSHLNRTSADHVCKPSRSEAHSGGRSARKFSKDWNFGFVPAKRLLRKGSEFGAETIRARMVDLSSMPRGMRLISTFGYACVTVFILATLVLEYFGNSMPETNFVSVSSSEARIPVPAVVISCIAYLVGWTLVLTGASDCRRRIFLPIVCAFLIQVLLGLKLVGGEGISLAAVCMVVLISGPALIHLIAPRLLFWRDYPVVESVYWGCVVSVFIASLWLFGGSVPLATTHVYIVFSELLLLSVVFWFILALDVVDLAVDLSRPTVGYVRLEERPQRAVKLVLASGLLLYPFLIGFLLRQSEGELIGVFLFCGFLFSVPIAVASLLLLLSKRWSPEASATLLALVPATLILSFGIMLSLGGQDFTELALSSTGIIPPLTLFAVLMAYDVLNFGLRFANTDGRIMPRTGRTLIYLGGATLVIGYAMFFLNMKGPSGGDSSEELQVFVNGVFMLGVMFLGPPYLLWIVWKRRDRLVAKPQRRDL